MAIQRLSGICRLRREQCGVEYRHVRSGHRIQLCPAATPQDLTATAGNAQVTLNWSTVAGATSYHVKRATSSGGPYATMANPTGGTYTDTQAFNGATYYYVVSALTAGAESANSTQASASLQSPVAAAPTGLDRDGHGHPGIADVDAHRTARQAITSSGPRPWRTLHHRGKFPYRELHEYGIG